MQEKKNATWMKLLKPLLVFLVATGLWEKGAAANAPEWLESARDLARNF